MSMEEPAIVFPDPKKIGRLRREARRLARASRMEKKYEGKYENPYIVEKDGKKVVIYEDVLDIQMGIFAEDDDRFGERIEKLEKVIYGDGENEPCFDSKRYDVLKKLYMIRNHIRLRLYGARLIKDLVSRHKNRRSVPSMIIIHSPLIEIKLPPSRFPYFGYVDKGVSFQDIVDVLVSHKSAVEGIVIAKKSESVHWNMIMDEINPHNDVSPEIKELLSSLQISGENFLLLNEVLAIKNEKVFAALDEMSVREAKIAMPLHAYLM